MQSLLTSAWHDSFWSNVIAGLIASAVLGVLGFAWKRCRFCRR
jgi:hypothetical protein